MKLVKTDQHDSKQQREVTGTIIESVKMTLECAG